MSQMIKSMVFETEISPEDRTFLEYFKMMYTGKYNAVKGKFLSHSEKYTQLIMQRLREAGYPICACQQGYYYSENPEDIKESLESYKTKRISMEKVEYGMLKAYQRALEA
jgi:hypothetical protein